MTEEFDTNQAPVTMALPVESLSSFHEEHVDQITKDSKKTATFWQATVCGSGCAEGGNVVSWEGLDDPTNSLN